MIILSVDCAGAHCGACVWQDGRVLCVKTENMERGQDAALMPLILTVVQESGVSFTDIDRIAAARGPGSFTGIRIGLAAARGLGFALAKPVIGIDRFSLYRSQFHDVTTSLCVVLESRREELYVQYYTVGGAARDPDMLPPVAIRSALTQDASVVVVGDAAEALSGFVSVLPPREEEVITIASLAALVSANDGEFLPRPYYLRAPDVTFAPKKERCARV